MSPPDCPAIHQKKSARTVTGNVRTRKAAHRENDISPARYNPDTIRQAPAPDQKTQACYRFVHSLHPSNTTSTTRRNIRSEESEHMITYGAPGARNISAFAA